MTSRYLENINDLSRTNHRMHNKLLIGDSTAAVVGGRNIADDYFGFGKARNFRDYDVFKAGIARTFQNLEIKNINFKKTQIVF